VLGEPFEEGFGAERRGAWPLGWPTAHLSKNLDVCELDESMLEALKAFLRRELEHEVDQLEIVIVPRRKLHTKLQSCGAHESLESR
jgi:hypothetical protein